MPRCFEQWKGPAWKPGCSYLEKQDLTTWESFRSSCPSLGAFWHQLLHTRGNESCCLGTLSPNYPSDVIPSESCPSLLSKARALGNTEMAHQTQNQPFWSEFYGKPVGWAERKKTQERTQNSKYFRAAILSWRVGKKNGSRLLFSGLCAFCKSK